MKEITQTDMLQLIRERVERSSQKDVADQLGITPQSMNDLVRGRRDISERIANTFGFRRVIKYRKIA